MQDGVHQQQQQQQASLAATCICRFARFTVKAGREATTDILLNSSASDRLRLGQPRELSFLDMSE